MISAHQLAPREYNMKVPDGKRKRVLLKQNVSRYFTKLYLIWGRYFEDMEGGAGRGNYYTL